MNQSAIAIPDDEVALADIVPLADFVQRSDQQVWNTLPSARQDIQKSDTNGLDDFGAIVRIRRRIHVVVPRWKSWLLSHHRK